MQDPEAEKKVYGVGETTPGGFTIETPSVNVDELPFGFYNPDTEGKLTWVCGYGKAAGGVTPIMSVFSFDNGSGTEKQVKQLADMKEAIFFRDELISNGWKKLIPPKIGFTVTKEDGTTSEMNRKQKRSLGKKMSQIAKTVDRNNKAL